MGSGSEIQSQFTKVQDEWASDPQQIHVGKQEDDGQAANQEGSINVGEQKPLGTVRNSLPPGGQWSCHQPSDH